MLTEIERRQLASQAVKIARAQPIGDPCRQRWLDTAREHITQANNLAFRARFAGGSK